MNDAFFKMGERVVKHAPNHSRDFPIISGGDAFNALIHLGV